MFYIVVKGIWHVSTCIYCSKVTLMWTSTCSNNLVTMHWISWETQLFPSFTCITWSDHINILLILFFTFRRGILSCKLKCHYFIPLLTKKWQITFKNSPFRFAWCRFGYACNWIACITVFKCIASLYSAFAAPFCQIDFFTVTQL